MKSICCFFLLIISFFHAAYAKPVVYTVNYPLAYFAEKIGGVAIDVVFPEIEEDPAFWDPDRRAVSGYQQADLILLNGANYAKWINKVSLPYSKMVDTSETFNSQLLVVKDAPTHHHGPKGKHEYVGIAFTTWIDPQLAILQAEAISKALIKLMPDQKDRFIENFLQLEAELNQLDKELQIIFANNENVTLIASHPVYDYLANRYSFNLKSLLWEPGQSIGDKQMDDLLKITQNHGAKIMIWEDEPLQESIDKLKEIGIKSVTYNPCGNRSAEGDYMEVMKSNLLALKSVIK